MNDDGLPGRGLRRTGGLFPRAALARAGRMKAAVTERPGAKAAVTERPGAMLKGAPPPPPAKGAPSGKGVAAGAVAPAAPPPSKISTFRQGDRCAVKSDTVSGTGVIQFVGEVASLGPGHWVGVLHDEPIGTSNGVIDGRRLFACPNKHGGFYAVHEIRVDKHADEKASAVSRRRPAVSRSHRCHRLGPSGTRLVPRSLARRRVSLRAVACIRPWWHSSRRLRSRATMRMGDERAVGIL